MNAQIDVRDVLPTIRVPTLVLHRAGDRCLLVEEGRHVASLIPGARFVTLPGDDHLPFVGDQDALLDEIERFLSVERARAETGRVLATVLCAVPGAARARPNPDEVDRVRALVAAHTRRLRGRELPPSGDRSFSLFEGPARAIRCARAIVEEAAQRGLSLGVGLHTGEWDSLRPDTGGPLADTAARIAQEARPGEVLVSRIVVDLVGAAGFEFSGGRHELAGEEALPLYAVR
jgi:class 3 adenylate cyclase